MRRFSHLFATSRSWGAYSSASGDLDRSKLEYDRRYYIRNEERKKDSARRYYFHNEEEEKESNRQYRQQNREKRKAADSYYRVGKESERRDYLREYSLQNRDKSRDAGRQYRLRTHKNPEAYVPRHATLRSWRTPELVRAFFDSVAAQLHISNPSDWCRISRAQIRSLGGYALYRRFEHLGTALRYAYPEIEWDLSNFSFKGKKSGQRWLRIKVAELLPAGVEIIEDYKHPELSWEKLGRQIELDIWIPQYLVGIEFQGEQHYYNLNTAFGPNGTASLYGERDYVKLTLCDPRGITLISIPYWWDGDKDSLSATLYQARPDVFPVSHADPVPLERPPTTVDSNLRDRSQLE